MRSEPRNWRLILVLMLFFVLIAAAVAHLPRAMRWYKAGLENLEDERISNVRAYMDEYYPVCALGETVAVKSASGGTIVGVFAGSGPGGILLESTRGRLATLPLHMFYPVELVRFDEYLRMVVLRKHAEIPYGRHKRLLLLVRPTTLDMDLVRTVELVRGHHCYVCYGTGMMFCSTCGGRGTVPRETTKPCQQCGGSGVHTARMGGSKSQCPFCRGTGSHQDTRYEHCATCDGTGKVPCSKCAL